MTAIGYLVVGFIAGWIMGLVINFIWLKALIASIPDPDDYDIEESA